MTSLTRIFGAMLLVLLLAATAMSTVYTYADIVVTNKTGKTITAKLHIDDGGGGRTAYIGNGDSYSFDTKETAWYMKDKTHNNYLYISFGDEKAVTLKITTENEVGFTGEAILGNVSISTVDNPLKCEVSSSHKAYIPLGSTSPPIKTDVSITLGSCE